MSSFSPAQKKAYAIKMQAQRAKSAPSKRVSVAKTAMPKKVLAKVAKQLASHKMVKRGRGTAIQPKGTVRKLAKSYARSIRGIPARLKGRGDYESAKAQGGKWGKSIGSALGFGDAGETVGEMAGSLFNLITGRGDYKVKQNSLINMGTPVPTFNDGTRSTIIEHREYIADISATVDFTNRVYPINPGLPASFPWLTSLAGNYEQYRIHGMVYQYKSLAYNATSADNIGTGSVILATQYDSANPPFSDKTHMLNHEYCTTTKPQCDMLHPIECAPNDGTLDVLYTRSGAPAVGTDIRMYDLGSFQIATEGQASASAGSVIGELWCSYSIELLKPQLSVRSEGLQSAHFQLNWSAGSTTTVPWGDAPPETPVAGSTMFPVLDNVSSGVGTATFTDIPNGNYLLMYSLTYPAYAVSAGTYNKPILSLSGTSAGILPMWAGDSVNNPGGQSFVIDVAGTGSLTGSDQMIAIVLDSPTGLNNFVMTITAQSPAVAYNSGPVGDFFITEFNSQIIGKVLKKEPQQNYVSQVIHGMASKHTPAEEKEEKKDELLEETEIDFQKFFKQMVQNTIKARPETQEMVSIPASVLKELESQPNSSRQSSNASQASGGWFKAK